MPGEQERSRRVRFTEPNTVSGRTDTAEAYPQIAQCGYGSSDRGYAQPGAYDKNNSMYVRGEQAHTYAASAFAKSGPQLYTRVTARGDGRLAPQKYTAPMLISQTNRGPLSVYLHNEAARGGRQASQTYLAPVSVHGKRNEGARGQRQAPQGYRGTRGAESHVYASANGRHGLFGTPAMRGIGAGPGFARPGVGRGFGVLSRPTRVDKSAGVGGRPGAGTGTGTGAGPGSVVGRMGVKGTQAQVGQMRITGTGAGSGARFCGVGPGIDCGEVSAQIQEMGNTGSDSKQIYSTDSEVRAIPRTCSKVRAMGYTGSEVPEIRAMGDTSSEVRSMGYAGSEGRVIRDPGTSARFGTWQKGYTNTGASIRAQKNV